jgi:hypothetical protein
MSSTRHRIHILGVLLAAGGLLAPPVLASGAAAPTWGPEEPVAVVPVDTYDSYPTPAVAVGTDGTAAAVWLAPRSAGGVRVVATRRAPDGGWSEPVPLSGRVRENAGSDVAVGPDGTVSVVWVRSTDAGLGVELARLDASGAVEVAPVGTGRLPEVVVDRDGRTTVAWVADGALQVRERSAAGAWTARRGLASRSVWSQDLAVNGSGTAVVAWFEWKGQRLRSSIRPAGKRWQRPQTLMADTRVRAQHAAVDSAGRAMVLWTTADEWRPAMREYRNGVAWARTGRDGDWSATRYLNRTVGEDGVLLDVATNPRGDGVALWLEGGLGGDDPYTLQAARFTTKGRWAATSRIARSWPAASAYVGADRVARVLVDTGWIRVTEQRPGAEWTAKDRVARGTLGDTAGNRSRWLATWCRAETDEGAPLWASVLEIG